MGSAESEPSPEPDATGLASREDREDFLLSFLEDVGASGRACDFWPRRLPGLAMRKEGEAGVGEGQGDRCEPENIRLGRRGGGEEDNLAFCS